uniref:HtrA serine peptidase 4 n=1 Tax=Gorilla gorilla gorilla TaxID=9595 RepID=G3QTA2_GORGO|nr:serine protease HTRA4 [Gorilla gorilla gorilla]
MIRPQLRPAGLGRCLLPGLLLLLVPVLWAGAEKLHTQPSCPTVCQPTRCPALPTCALGTTPVFDLCRCCRVCPAAEREVCGGAQGQPCAPGLQCLQPLRPGFPSTCSCPTLGGAVCGSDRRTYPSMCALRAENRAARRLGKVPAVPVQWGNCGDTGTRSAGPLRRNYNFIAAVVEKVAPSVVHVQLWGRLLHGSRLVPVYSGSGFIVSEDGLIITNAHVVRNQQWIEVALQNGARYEAVVKDIDLKLDLAVIKIEPNAELPVLMLGRSSDLRAGEFVVALGSPFSLQNTATAGIVSTKQRGGKELGMKDSDMDYIQIDATINNGNSGGPLVNLDGDVIGVNSLRVTDGISFAIPSDRVRQFLAEYHEHQMKGKAFSNKKYLGLQMLSLTVPLSEELKMHYPDFPNVSSGVYVCKVVEGTAAQSSGLRDHDVIVNINGKPITTTTDVVKALDSDSLSMAVLRGKDNLLLTVIPETIN